MSISDIISILALEKEFWIISEAANIDTDSPSKFKISKDNIGFLYIDSSKILRTISFNLKSRTRVCYKNIDYILIRDEITGLSIELPLKYSNRYKMLVE